MKHQLLPLAMMLATTIASSVVFAATGDNKQPMVIESNHFLGDELHKTAVYTGAVLLNQGTLRMTGNRLEVEETEKGWKKGTMSGKATFRQKRDPKTPNIEEWIYAKADKIVYEESNGHVTLIGNAEVERRENGISKDRTQGAKIVYDSIRSRTIVKGNREGRASTVIVPRTKSTSTTTPAASSNGKGINLNSSSHLSPQ